MNPVLDARLRRRLPLVMAIVTSTVFLAIHSALFRPMVQRYEQALKAAGESGAVVDDAGLQSLLPPRVHALLMEHSLGEADAAQKSRAGLLGAELTQQLSEAAGRNQLSVLIAEPDAGGETPTSIHPRAHLRMRGKFSSLLALLDDLARTSSLVTVERLTVTPVSDGLQDIDFYASGFILRRVAAKP